MHDQDDHVRSNGVLLLDYISGLSKWIFIISNKLTMKFLQLFHIPFHVNFILGISQETLLVIFKANFLNIKGYKSCSINFCKMPYFPFYCSHLARPLSCWLHFHHDRT